MECIFFLIEPKFLRASNFLYKDLLFTATERGIYVSLNGGTKWQKLPGSPTISFRDITIQKREINKN